MKAFPHLLLLAIAGVALSACHRTPPAEALAPLLGKTTTVQFRRDALGAAAALPISPLTSGINGSEMAMQGTLKMVSPEWILLEKAGGQIWIPRSVVLLMTQ